MRPSLYDFIYAIVFCANGIDESSKNIIVIELHTIFKDKITYDGVFNLHFTRLILREGNEYILWLIRKAAEVYYSMPEDERDPCNYMVHHAGGFTDTMSKFVKDMHDI